MLNGVFITLATALVLALFAALVGPYFVDWTTQRAFIEERAEEVLGTDVALLGDVDVRLLPVPRLILTDVRVGPREKPVLEAAEVEIDVELPPLLSGNVRIADLWLGRPVLTLAVDGEGRLVPPPIALSAPPGEWFDTDAVEVASLAVLAGRLVVDDARRNAPVVVSEIDAVGAARSLKGPFSVDGFVDLFGERLAIDLSTGRMDGDGLVLRASLAPRDAPLTLSVDGTVRLADGAPSFAGDIQVSGGGAGTDEADEAALGALVAGETGPGAFRTVPWTLAGQIEIDADDLLVREIEARVGGEALATTLTGALAVPLTGNAPFAARLAARQLDLDRLAGRAPDETDGAGEPLARLLPAIAALPRPGAVGTVSVAIETVVVGGDLVRDVAVEATLLADGLSVEGARARLPGDGAVRAEGFLAAGAAPSFEGPVSLSVDRPARLVRWWRGAGGATPAVLLGALEASGRLAAGNGALAVTDLSLALPGTEATGSLAWRSGRGGGAGSLSLALDARTLDIGAAADLLRIALAPAMAGGAAPAGLDLDLEAATVTAGDFSGDGLSAGVTLARGTLAIDRLHLDSLGGATLTAAGTIERLFSAPEGTIEASLEAGAIDGLVGILARLAPEAAVTGWLAAAAPRLAPLALDARIEGAAGDGLAVRLSGTAGETALSADARLSGAPADWRSAPLTVSGEVAARDGARLLAAFGLPVVPVGEGEASRLSFTLDGSAADGLAAGVSGRLLSLEVAAEGFLVPGAADPVRGVALTLAGEDVTEAALLAGMTFPRLVGSVPGRLAADASVEGGRLVLSSLEASVAGVGASGTLVLARDGERPALSGELAVSGASLSFLSGLVLGPEAVAPVEGGIPEAPLGPPRLAGLDIDLALTTPTLDLAGRTVEDASLALSRSQGRLSLSAVSGRLAGGRLSGALTLTRAGELATATGRIALKDVSLAPFVPAGPDGPLAAGRADLVADLAGGGPSVSAILDGLGGSGALSLRDLRVEALGPGLFAAAEAAVEAERIVLSPAAVSAFLDERLLTGALRAHQAEVAFTVAEGSVVFGPVDLTATGPDGEAAQVSASGRIGLVDGTVDARVEVALPARDPLAVAPSLAVSLEGNLSGPDAAVSATGLVNALTARAIERRAREVERLEAEIVRDAARRAADGASPPPDGAAEREGPSAAAPGGERSADAPPADGDVASPPGRPPADGSAEEEATDAGIDDIGRLIRRSATPAARAADPFAMTPMPPPVAVAPPPGAATPLTGR